MAKCARCGAETILHVNGTPVCTDCDSKSSQAASGTQLRKASESDERKKYPVRDGA